MYGLASSAIPCRRAHSGLKMVLRLFGNAVVLWFFEAVD
jgi:hypothetical protein